MKMRAAKGNVDHARQAAEFIARHINVWKHGMSITVEAYVPPRTQKQNGLYHLLIQRYSEQNGDHPDDLKRAFASEFGPRKIINLRDKQVSVPKSSTEWSKEEMSSMIERVRHEAAELNYNLD